MLKRLYWAKNLCWAILLCPMACVNYWGNPYRKTLPPRLVLVDKTALQVEPRTWQAPPATRQVLSLSASFPGIAEYTVRLSQAKGITLLRYEKGDTPDCLHFTLKIGKKAPTQRPILIFEKGDRVITRELPIYRK